MPATLTRLREIGGSSDRTEEECWPWRDSTSYGHLGGRRVHVRALELTLGRPVRPGYYACHRCNNPRCFNPAHVYEGRPADNSADMLARFGGPQGSYGLTSAERAALMRGSAGERARAARWERSRIPRVTRECAWCKAEFETPVRGHRVRKFCSAECAKNRYKIPRG